MSEAEELIALIKGGKVSKPKLREFLESAKEQLRRYEKALALITDATERDWSYDLWQEALRVGSGGTGSQMPRSEWDGMLPEGRAKLRTKTIATLQEGKSSFLRMTSAIEARLGRPRWKFWG